MTLRTPSVFSATRDRKFSSATRFKNRSLKSSLLSDCRFCKLPDSRNTANVPVSDPVDLAGRRSDQPISSSIQGPKALDAGIEIDNYFNRRRRRTVSGLRHETRVRRAMHGMHAEQRQFRRLASS